MLVSKNGLIPQIHSTQNGFGRIPPMCRCRQPYRQAPVGFVRMAIHFSRGHSFLYILRYLFTRNHLFDECFHVSGHGEAHRKLSCTKNLLKSLHQAGPSGGRVRRVNPATAKIGLWRSSATSCATCSRRLLWPWTCTRDSPQTNATRNCLKLPRNARATFHD